MDDGIVEDSIADAIIEVRGVSVSFGGLTAVADLDFAVPRGAIKAVIGPNGAGKTTLFNVISGVQAPSSGHVLLAGEDVTATAAHERVQRGLARTFQNLQVFSGMSVLENVAFPLDRLNELAREGVIGSVADFHYSFMGAAPIRKIEPKARELAGLLKKDRVDAVLLSPV